MELNTTGQRMTAEYQDWTTEIAPVLIQDALTLFVVSAPLLFYLNNDLGTYRYRPHRDASPACVPFRDCTHGCPRSQPPRPQFHPRSRAHSCLYSRRDDALRDDSFPGVFFPCDGYGECGSFETGIVRVTGRTDRAGSDAEVDDIGKTRGGDECIDSKKKLEEDLEGARTGSSKSALAVDADCTSPRRVSPIRLSSMPFSKRPTPSSTTTLTCRG
jgi:hypothetical protein